MSTLAPQPDQVRAALGELLGWSELARSPQLSKFLNHIVEAKLRGDEANIKAYSIAVDVFGRPATFDPQVDPIVRVQARRLRGLLQEFYRQNLSRAGARITLPVGRYVPEFELSDSGEALQGIPDDLTDPSALAPAVTVVSGPGNARFGRRFWVQAGAAMVLVLLLGALLYGLQVLREPPVLAPVVDVPPEPTVYVSSFTNLAGIPMLDSFTSRLSDQLSSILAQFEDVQVGYIKPGEPLGKRQGAFLLSGTVTGSGSGIEVAAVLTDVMNGSAVWNTSLRQPMPQIDDEVIASTVSRKIMREIGPFRGPVHAAGRKWLDDHMPQIPTVSNYVCLLAYRYAREFNSAAAIAKALDCYERLLAQQPDLPLALAASAWLQGRVIYNRASPNDRLDIALAAPLELATRAQELAPESSFAHEQVGAVLNWQENYEVAQRNFAIALGFEPLNTDARANYAITLARLGDWGAASQQANFAIADAPYASPWYYFIPALLALRDGRFDKAIENGRTAAPAGELGSIIALAAAGLANRSQVVAEMQPLVMSMEGLRRVGIMPWVGIRIKDALSLSQISAGLKAAGIPESALTAQF